MVGGKAQSGARAVLLAVCLLALPGTGAAAPAAVPGGVRSALTGDVLADFCTDLKGIVAAENAREHDDFARSLDEARSAGQAELDKRVARSAANAEDDEGAPALTWGPEDALLMGRYLWQRWVPTAPAADLAITEDRPDAWLLAPAPSADPGYAGDPIRVDKATGQVTWKLPHPSERERLYDSLCGGRADAAAADPGPAGE